MKSFYNYCFLFQIFFISTNAHGGYVIETNTNKPISVKEALKTPDKTKVTLEGYLLTEIRRQKYEFSDEKDTICVEIEEHDKGQKIMPQEDFDKNQKIRIQGNMDKDFEPFGDKCDKMKIKVSKVELLNKK